MLLPGVITLLVPLFPLGSLLNLGPFWGLWGSKFCKESFRDKLVLFIRLLLSWLFGFWIFCKELFKLLGDLFAIVFILLPIYNGAESILVLFEFMFRLEIELFIRFIFWPIPGCNNWVLIGIFVFRLFPILLTP